MKTIRSIAAGNTLRLSPRLKLASTRLGSLILLFQRMPVVQFLFPEASIMGSATVANSVSLAVTTVVGLGVFDSVAGASAIVQLTPINSTTIKDVPSAINTPLNFSFKVTGVPSVAEVWYTTTLPSGLIHTNVTNNSTDSITGTPTAAGTTSVTITAEGHDSGERKSQVFKICVLGFSTQPAATTTINSGDSTTLNCVVIGKPSAATLTYQWFQGAPPSETTPVGTNSPSFTTPSNLTSSTSYWVKVTSTLSGYAVSAKSSTAVVNVNPVSSPFDTWASTSGLPEGQRGATQTPQNDGVTNLMKYACNLNPLAPDVSKLTVGGSETKGLPVQSTVGGKLRMEFLRRKASPNPGITYFVEFSSDMGGASWSSQDVSTSPAGSPVGTEWERVVVDDPTGGTARFGRVKVVQP